MIFLSSSSGISKPLVEKFTATGKLCFLITENMAAVSNPPLKKNTFLLNLEHAALTLSAIFSSSTFSAD